jgi:hypothetical protein
MNPYSKHSTISESTTCLPAQAEISRRMLRRLEHIDNETTAGPVTPTARPALASSVVAHAVVEPETQCARARL